MKSGDFSFYGLWGLKSPKLFLYQYNSQLGACPALYDRKEKRAKVVKDRLPLLMMRNQVCMYTKVCVYTRVYIRMYVYWGGGRVCVKERM